MKCGNFDCFVAENIHKTIPFTSVECDLVLKNINDWHLSIAFVVIVKHQRLVKCMLCLGMGAQNINLSNYGQLWCHGIV